MITVEDIYVRYESYLLGRTSCIKVGPNHGKNLRKYSKDRLLRRKVGTSDARRGLFQKVHQVNSSLVIERVCTVDLL